MRGLDSRPISPKPAAAKLRRGFQTGPTAASQRRAWGTQFAYTVPPMALLSIANLVFSYGDRHILDGVNLTLDAGQHVGMVGRNGCGKSTLMRLIAGLEAHKPDAGQVQLARGATAGYLRQDPNLDPDKTLREEAQSAFAELEALHTQLEQVAHDMAEAEGEALEKLLVRYEQLEHDMQAKGGYAVDHLVEQTLHGLGLTDDFFDVKVKGLSGGQKGRLALAKLLLSHPDILLLDEPTNHLDIAGRQWLEQFLAEYSGAVIVISHDRWLLDRVVSHIYELEAGRLVDYPGNYEQYRELRLERRTAAARAFDKQQTKIKQEQAFINRYRAGQRAKQAQGREKRLERYKRDEMLELPPELETMRLAFRKPPRCGDQVLAAENIAKAYDGKALFDGLTFTLKRGQRVGVIGPNGAGKSTLVRCLLGEQEPDTGGVKPGSNVSVGHYKQTHEHLPLQLTVVDYLRRFVPNETEQEARDLAGAFLFSGDDQDKPLQVLSGGERSRSVLAGLVAGGHNLLVLDEPTNHLDIPSAERLEEALRQYTSPAQQYGQNKGVEGTLLLITHDRMLLDHLVDELLVFDGEGSVKHFLGTYSEYAESLEKANQPPPVLLAEKPKPRPKQESKPKSKKKPTKKASGGGGRFGHMNQEKLEARIEAVESRLTEIDFELANPDVFRDGEKVKALQAERTELQEELKPLEAEWSSRVG